MKNILRKIKNKVVSKLKKDPFPSYETKRKIINNHRKKYSIKIFVETGTFLGDTIEFLKKDFDILYSIELSEELASRAINRFQGQKNITIIQGDSGVLLSDIVNKLDEPAMFWLDGHYSSEFFIGDEFFKTAKSDKNTPIVKELNAIFKSPLAHVILIDDARLFTGKLDYPDLNELREIIRQSKPDYTLRVKNDIIRILPKLNS